MRQIEVHSYRQAVSTILELLEDEFSGSLPSQLDARMIEEDNSDDALARIYTHPGLPEVTVVVPWEWEA